MKNFNLEDLERKTIYKLPDSSFQELQKRVLLKTVEKETLHSSKEKKTRVIPMPVRWAYAAAAIVLMLGLGLVIKNGSVSDSVIEEQAIAQEVKAEQMPSTSDSEIALASNMEVPVVEEGVNLTSPVVSNPKVSTTRVQATPAARSSAGNSVRSIARPVSIRNEAAAEQILSTFSTQDLADLSRDAELDVYLDLY